jgi:hypothetical protein
MKSSFITLFKVGFVTGQYGQCLFAKIMFTAICMVSFSLKVEIYYALGTFRKFAGTHHIQ